MATHISKSRHAQSLAPQFHIDDKIFRFPPAGTPTGTEGPRERAFFSSERAARSSHIRIFGQCFAGSGRSWVVITQ